MVDTLQGQMALIVSTAMGVLGGVFTYAIKRWVERVDREIEKLENAYNSIIPKVAKVEEIGSEATNRLNRIELKIDSLITSRHL